VGFLIPYLITLHNYTHYPFRRLSLSSHQLIQLTYPIPYPQNLGGLKSNLPLTNPTLTLQINPTPSTTKNPFLYVLNKSTTQQPTNQQIHQQINTNKSTKSNTPQYPIPSKTIQPTNLKIINNQKSNNPKKSKTILSTIKS